MLLFQDSELLPKGQVFQQQVVARTDRLSEKDEQEPQRTEHEPVLTKASRISMQTAFGSCTLHGLHYPTKKHAFQSVPVVYQPKDVCVASMAWLP